MDKIYKLEIPRNHYDRIADAFTEPNGMIAIGFDGKKDTVIFTISEQLRKRLAKHAVKQKNHLYWITQIFLPQNINQYEVQ